MKRVTDRQWLILGMIGAVIVAIISAAIAPAPPPPPLSARNADENGALALRLWLEESGYSVQQMSSDTALDSLDVLFILGDKVYSDVAAEQIRDWVQRGGTLIVGIQTDTTPFAFIEQNEQNNILTAFDISTDLPPSSDQGQNGRSLSAPTLITPPVQNLNLGEVYGITTERTDLVGHMTTGNIALVASVDEGAGHVWISGGVRPFTNVGIQEEGSAALILNFLADVPPNARIGFDERLNTGSGEQTLNDWLFKTAPGWGILSAVGLTFAFLALRGRRFGVAVPLPDDRLRREPFEYIRAIANLYRRSGQREEMARHYHRGLRRRLIEHYGLDPALSDQQLVETIVKRDSDVDGAALRDLLKRLSQQNISEADLIRAASEATAWMRKH
ncbi:MAG: DUF4350 domain-containing protein [Chitinophagaceae bacterium]|nr:DUF4350 domain-containing protein [Anaerolineae bacterium]